jgi:hypothetical protein
MSTVPWRRLLLGLCAFAMIQVGIVVWMASSAQGVVIGTSLTSPFLVSGLPRDAPFIHRIGISPHTALNRTGKRIIYFVDLRPLSASDRYRWRFNHFLAGEQITVPVLHGNVDRISFTAKHYPASWDAWLAYVGWFWVLLFAALIAWRRAESAEARTLSFMLIAWVLGSSFLPNNWVTRWTGADAVAGVLAVAAGYWGYALFATYAMLFARPPALLRSGLAWLSYGSAGLVVLYGIVATVGVWTRTADPDQAWYFGVLPQVITSILPILFPVICVIATLAQTRGAERARMAWASASVGFLFLAYLIGGVIGVIATFHTSHAGAYSPSILNLVYQVENIAMFIAPMGLTYALLSRRLLDVGFVINQAAVYSGVSIIVVGLFMLGEWVLGAWFSHVSHMTNLEVSAALAIGLGFSVRAIHTRVDGTLDRVFFRKRHEDEIAIRAFADEAAEVTDDATLLRSTKETLETHAGASFVTLAMDDGRGHYGDVSEDDPAIVALRERHKPLDLQTLSTGLRGDFAYPMIARGRLVGALVLGSKLSGESYAPDESRAIMHLAHSVGSALHILFLAKVLQEHHLGANL